MSRPLESIRRLASRSGATIKTGVEATVELVEILEPDVVVLATGAEPATLQVAGLDGALTGNEVLTENTDTGSRVLVVGGGMVGIEVAEFLATNGKAVTVIEILGDVARDMLPITRKLTLNRLQHLKVEILTETELQRVESGKAVVNGPDGRRELGPFDSVVVAVGTRSSHELAIPLLARGLEVHVVGDAADLKQILGAVQSAWEVACSI
jgi:pyruvate/2-oxoglutarate dehydrogenase complex dihydrolipoamide dehydrogenase (E3) component